MDDLIKRAPAGRIPAGIHARVLANFRRRYHRLQAIQIGGSTILILAGVWLFAPWLAWLVQQVELPEPGLASLRGMAAYLDTGPAAMRTIQNAAFMQTSLTRSIGALDALGLLALVAGAAIAISLLMRRRLW